MKNSMLIHRMADWLDRKYLSQNTVSPRRRSPWYDTMASSDRAVTTSIRLRSGRQAQASQTSAGTAAMKMPLSYTSMASW